MSKKKKLLIVLLIFLALCIPIPMMEKDGGSRCWKAVIWEVTELHRFEGNGYREGIEIRLLFGKFKVYERSEIVPFPECTPATETQTSP